jgi:hypothetical protein
MKKSSKIQVFKVLIVLLMCVLTSNTYAQKITKYDYAEIIVLQKVAKNKSEYKQIYLNSTTSKTLKESEIKGLENNSSLLKYMNQKNWEYVERLGSQPSNSGPIWINYTFRKKIN